MLPSYPIKLAEQVPDDISFPNELLGRVHEFFSSERSVLQSPDNLILPILLGPDGKRKDQSFFNSIRTVGRNTSAEPIAVLGWG